MAWAPFGCCLRPSLLPLMLYLVFHTAESKSSFQYHLPLLPPIILLVFIFSSRLVKYYCPHIMLHPIIEWLFPTIYTKKKKLINKKQIPKMVDSKSIYVLFIFTRFISNLFFFTQKKLIIQHDIKFLFDGRSYIFVSPICIFVSQFISLSILLT